MDREDLKISILNLTDVSTERETIYAAMDELGINYKRTNCKRCLTDYLNIVKEELGLIPSAAEVSDFNGEKENDCKDYKYRYLKNAPVAWMGHIMDQNTDPTVISEFLKRGPRGYYIIEK